jgi:arylsulfatase
LQALKDTDQWDNTLIFFLSDNGGCAEELSDRTRNWVAEGKEHTGTLNTTTGSEVKYGNYPDILPGAEDTYCSYGVPWANVSNTPFRLYKHWVHEGGIATPLIAHWPAGIDGKNELRHQPAQLPDVMATFLSVAGVEYPGSYEGRTVKPLEGFSMVPTFSGRDFDREVLYWEHEGNRAARKGKWKLVTKFPGGWELYDMETDRTELSDVSGHFPEIVQDLSSLYEKWAARCGIRPWQEVLDIKKRNKSDGWL